MWERIKKALVPNKQDESIITYTTVVPPELPPWCGGFQPHKKQSLLPAVTCRSRRPYLPETGFQFAARKCYSLKSCCTAHTNAVLSENGILSYFSPSLHFMAIFYHLFFRLSSTLNYFFHLTQSSEISFCCIWRASGAKVHSSKGWISAKFVQMYKVLQSTTRISSFVRLIYIGKLSLFLIDKAF